MTLIAIQNNIWHRSRKGKLSRRIVCARLFPVANCYHITNPISYSFWARSYLIFSYLLCVYRCHGLISGQWDVGRSESCLFQAWPLQLSHLQRSMFFLLLTEWRWWWGSKRQTRAQDGKNHCCLEDSHLTKNAHTGLWPDHHSVPYTLPFLGKC